MPPKLLDAYIPPAEQSMRSHAVGRQRDWAIAAKELAKVFQASPPATPEPSRRYVTAEEAVADLGLEPQVRKAAEQGIRDMVSEQATGFSVAKTLRGHGVRQPIVKELLARGMRMAAELRAARSVSELYVRKAGPPPGAGWQPIPKGKKGGYRRPKGGGGWEYAYPDADGSYTSHDAPAADEGAHVHEEHETGTPDPKVRARMEQMEKKAKDAGLSFTGQATSRTTMKHLNELEKQLDRAIAQKRKREQGGGEGDNTPKKKLTDADVDATPDPSAKSPDAGSGEGESPTSSGGDPEAAPEPTRPEPTQKDQRARHMKELADRKGVPAEQLDQLLADPDFQTDEGQHALIEHLESLPDLVDDLPDEVPEDKGARAKLEAHAAKLEETVSKMERALAIERDRHGQEIAALRGEIRNLASRPTPRETVAATHKVWAFALLSFGFAAGFLFAGPMGALLGGSMANQYLRTGVAKSLPYEPPRLSPGLWLVGDDLVLVKATRHPEGAGWMSIPGGKKGGYRRPKSGGGYEYWYADASSAHEAAAHHKEKAAEHRGYAERTRVKSEATVQGAIADEHEEHARIAQDAKPGERHVDGDNPHKGKRTLGPDEGKVWTTVADLFQGHPPTSAGAVYLGHGDRIGPEYVSVKAADGRLHNIHVEVEVGDGFGGVLQSRTVPSVGPDGRLDYEKTVQKPHRVVIKVPAGFSDRDRLLERARRTLAHELAHAMDNLTGAHAKRNQEAYGEHGDAYYNDPTEIVAYRHNIFRELNTPEVAKDTKAIRDAFRSSPEETKDTRAFLREDGDDVGPLAVSETPNLGADRVIAFLEKHSETWAQVSPFLSPANRRKMLTTAAAVLQAHHDDVSEPAEKSLPAPPDLPAPPPRIRARHGANEHGHTDGLVPGQRLAVRKGAKGPSTVTVFPEGAFMWGDKLYPNGRQLLKALTGKDDHKLTVRRYFGLGTEAARLAKAMADALRVKHPDLLVSPYQGRVRVEGALAAAGIPVDNPLDTTTLLDLQAVQAILSPEPS